MKEEQEIEIDLLEIFYYLRAKLGWLILSFVLGGLAAGCITYFLITPKYTATSKIYMVSASSESVLNLSDLNLGTSLSQDYEELIKLRPVFNEVIGNLELDYEYEELNKKLLRKNEANFNFINQKVKVDIATIDWNDLEKIGAGLPPTVIGFLCKEPIKADK